MDKEQITDNTYTSTAEYSKREAVTSNKIRLLNFLNSFMPDEITDSEVDIAFLLSHEPDVKTWLWKCTEKESKP